MTARAQHARLPLTELRTLPAPLTRTARSLAFRSVCGGLGETQRKAYRTAKESHSAIAIGSPDHRWPSEPRRARSGWHGAGASPGFDYSLHQGAPTLAVVYMMRPGRQTMKTCPDCNGDGVIDKGTDDEKQCPTCGGSGFVPDDNDDKNNEEVIRT
jgi:hypothetical protein